MTGQENEQKLIALQEVLGLLEPQGVIDSVTGKVIEVASDAVGAIVEHPRKAMAVVALAGCLSTGIEGVAAAAESRPQGLVQQSTIIKTPPRLKTPAQSVQSPEQADFRPQSKTSKLEVEPGYTISGVSNVIRAITNRNFKRTLLDVEDANPELGKHKWDLIFPEEKINVPVSKNLVPQITSEMSEEIAQEHHQTSHRRNQDAAAPHSTPTRPAKTNNTSAISELPTHKAPALVTIQKIKPVDAPSTQNNLGKVTVHKGDTLYDIAEDIHEVNGVPILQELKSLEVTNGISSKYQIRHLRIGEQLVWPRITFRGSKATILPTSHHSPAPVISVATNNTAAKSGHQQHHPNNSSAVVSTKSVTPVTSHPTPHAPKTSHPQTYHNSVRYRPSRSHIPTTKVHTQKHEVITSSIHNYDPYKLSAIPSIYEIPAAHIQHITGALINLDVTPKTAAWITGSILQESGGNPTEYGDNGNAWGLIQAWPNRRHVQLPSGEVLLMPANLDQQLAFIVNIDIPREGALLSQYLHQPNVSAKLLDKAVEGWERYRYAGKRGEFARQIWSAMTPSVTRPSTPTINPAASLLSSRSRIVDYSQYDPSWRNHRYGNSTIGASGCGPTSVAEVISSETGHIVSPITTADWATSHGGIGTHGTSWQTVLINEPESFGLHARQIRFNEIGRVIMQHGMVIVAGGGNSSARKPFTRAGHILAIVSEDTSDRFELADTNSPPSNPGNPQQRYSLNELIVDGMHAAFAITK